jgi:hypothetical protein
MFALLVSIPGGIQPGSTVIVISVPTDTGIARTRTILAADSALSFSC